MTTAEFPSPGVWAEIGYRLIPANSRSGVPPDTAETPYMVRVRGWLAGPARPGEHVSVRTVTGRVRHGVLIREEPGDDHTFGRPHPALLRAVAGIQTQIAQVRGE